jgi:hypothetical protein
MAQEMEHQRNLKEAERIQRDALKTSLRVALKKGEDSRSKSIEMIKKTDEVERTLVTKKREVNKLRREYTKMLKNGANMGNRKDMGMGWGEGNKAECTPRKNLPLKENTNMKVAEESIKKTQTQKKRKAETIKHTEKGTPLLEDEHSAAESLKRIVHARRACDRAHGVQKKRFWVPDCEGMTQTQKKRKAETIEHTEKGTPHLENELSAAERLNRIGHARRARD